MADRTVTVALRAMVTDFRRGMRGAADETRKASGQVTDFAEQHQQLGMAATAAGTAVLAGLGAAATGASNFEAELNRMVGLVGVSRSQVDEWSDQLLALGPEVGKSPRELAEAMFFVTSAGFEGAEAMDVLEQSAKASAAGLGETKTIADAVTSAINAYGAENINASEATDTLVAAVREGKLEAESLTPVLGELLPLASELGIEFDETAGFLAAMSRTGLDANKAATGLRGIMSRLVKPTQRAEETLEQFGLSSEGLRRQVREEGLLAALQTLEGTFGDNEEAMSRVFEDVRGLTGVLNVLGQDAATVDGIMQGVAESTGATDRAFDAWGETTDAALDRFRESARAAALAAGDDLSPALAGAADTGATLLEQFQALPEPVRKVATLFTGAAGVGSLIAGGMILALPRIRDTINALRDLGLTADVLRTKLGRRAGLAAAFFVSATAASILISKLGDLTGHTNDLSDLNRELELFARTGRGLPGDIGGLEGVVRSLDQFANPDVWERVGGTISRGIDFVGQLATLGQLDVRGTNIQMKAELEALDQQLSQLVQSGNADLAAQAFDRIAAAAQDAGVDISVVTEAFPEYRRELELANAEAAQEHIQETYGNSLLFVGRQADEASGPVGDLGGQVGDTGDEAEDATSKLEELRNELRAQTDPVFALTDALDQVDQAQQAYNDAVDEHGRNSEEARAASVRQAKALSALEAEAIAGERSWSQFNDRLDGWVASGRITERQAAQIRDRVRQARREAEDWQGRYRANMVLDVQNMDDAAEAVRLLNRLRRFDGQHFSVSVGAQRVGRGVTVGHDGGWVTPAGIRMHSGGMIGLGADEVPAVLQTGELVLSRDQVRHLRQALPALAPRQPAPQGDAESGDTIVNLRAYSDRFSLRQVQEELAHEGAV